MNRSLRQAVLLAFAATVAASPAFAKKKGEDAAEGTPATGPVATVNGKAIPRIRAEALIAGQTAQGKPDNEELRKAVREELVRREILTQEALRKGLEKKSEVQGQMDLARQGVLIGAYLNDYVRTHPITDEQIKREYDGTRNMLGNKEYKVRHILVEKEDEAKALIERLNKGEKFEELAKQSKDPGSKDRGGDLDWANPTAFVKPFSDAMVKLEKGKFTGAPVKSDFGWHVIQLDDTRELQLPPIEQVKGQIGAQLQQRLVQQHIEELRAKAKVD